jgi:UDP-N-acetylmuramyl pentapeptide synthase
LAAHFDQIAEFATPVAHLDEVLPALGERIAAGDVVLFKGSHGTGLHEIVAGLMNQNMAVTPNTSVSNKPNLGPQ